MPAAAHEVAEPLVVSGSSDINGSVHNDTVVQRNCFLHVRGNLKGSLTIEEGANVVIEGSIDGRVVNRGGRLAVYNKGIAEFVAAKGPPQAEAGGVLKIDLSAIVLNWGTLTRGTAAECAAVVKADAYGLGIGPVTSALAKTGCRIFFVSDLAEARRARAAAPQAAIYVLNGQFAETGRAFADINAQPVINSPVEMAEWDAFVRASGWTGGFALNVDTGTSRFGISPDEAAALAPRSHSSDHRITLLMSHLDNADSPNHPANDSQIKLFGELRRLFDGVPTSLCDAPGIFLDPKAHFDLVRADAALYGANPTPGKPNPMQGAVELNGRIRQLRKLMPGESVAGISGWTAKRQTRVAIVAVGYADGYPRAAGAGTVPSPRAIVAGKPCAVVGRPAMDVVAIDVTGLPPTEVQPGDMATLIGGGLGIEDAAAAAQSSAGELLCHLGRRFHRIYYAS